MPSSNDSYLKIMNAIEDKAVLNSDSRNKVEAYYSALVGKVKAGIMLPYEAIVTYRAYVISLERTT